MIRYPLEPLLALTRHPEGRRLSLGELADRAGLNPSTVQKYGKRGIPEARAEHLAVACGFDPYVVWPDTGIPADLSAVEQACDLLMALWGVA